MGCGRMPLYPPSSFEDRENCYRIPLFHGESCGGCGCGETCCGQTVRLENPCRAGEYAEVTLSVDACGNLSICVHRGAPLYPCGRRPRRC